MEALHARADSSRWKMTLAKENGSQLSITPSELKFRFQLGKNIPTIISLHNPTSWRIAFKVKTTSPKKYCVRPSSGFIDPNGTKDVEIIMQAQKEYPPDLGNCRDKFLLQSTVAPSGDEVSSEMFDKSKNKEVRESKLRVHLEGPPAPPSPIPENATEEDTLMAKEKGVKERTQAVSFASANNPRDLAGELDKTKSERDQLKKKLDAMDVQMDGRSAGQAMVGHGFSLIQLILVALIAFLLGHYTS